MKLNSISEYSLMIFRIIRKYVERIKLFPEQLQKTYSDTLKSNFLDSDISKLDVILSLIKIHRENRFIYFRKKVLTRIKEKIESTGKKQFAKYLPFIVDNQPLLFRNKAIISKICQGGPPSNTVLFYLKTHFI